MIMRPLMYNKLFGIPVVQECHWTMLHSDRLENRRRPTIHEIGNVKRTASLTVLLTFGLFSSSILCYVWRRSNGVGSHNDRVLLAESAFSIGVPCRAHGRMMSHLTTFLVPSIHFGCSVYIGCSGYFGCSLPNEPSPFGTLTIRTKIWLFLSLVIMSQLTGNDLWSVI